MPRNNGKSLVNIIGIIQIWKGNEIDRTKGEL